MIFSEGSYSRQGMAILALLLLLGFGFLGMLFFPDIWVTILTGLLGFILVLASPIMGVVIILLLVYFPLFSNISLGLVEISVSTLPVVALAMASAFRLRLSRISGWQLGLQVFLLLGFLLTTFVSRSVVSSLKLLPNLLMYVLILFSTGVLLEKKEDFIVLARAVILLTLGIILWQYGIRPLRYALGIPLATLGANGFVFVFHPALGLSLMTLFHPPAGLTGRWRLLAVLVFPLVVWVSVKIETRAFWISALCIMALLFLMIRPRLSRAAVILGILLFMGLSAGFAVSLQQNFERSRTSLSVFAGTENVKKIDSSDLIRLLAFEGGKKMFLERPLVGQGPNLFATLKPLFVQGETRFITGGSGGAFNAWLMVLSEMGLVGFLPVLLAFITPLGMLLRELNKDRDRKSDPVFALALAWGLATLSLGIHLLFIDLMYGTFVWINVGISIALARYCAEKDHPGSKPAAVEGDG